ncbi:bifunctional diguanylate cyclase/phosphodiesterase [Pseudoxanthomonas dokdonensis]|uniref:Diguanylate cyclase n=1 Tax=Pseudoxanthomonas dokdonensis TaxID=344882 RepID=A0A0R0CEK0_9GAMM|nr:EAL domain-containing protein [Pseudoxanthomonas dokdonensis]KRG68205.1 diguanylate cyclase [Pseudoxanthomonas dokdonensis]
MSLYSEPDTAVSPGDALLGLRGISPPAWALTALLLGLVLTGLLAYRDMLVQREHLRGQWEALADRVPRQLQSPFERTAAQLRAMQTVFLANDRIDQAQFARYNDNLMRSNRLGSHLSTGFARRMPGPRYVYELVTPQRNNESLLQFDIARQRPNMQALLAARDADTPVLSAPFRVRQLSQGSHPLGVTVRLPVYSSGPYPRTVPERRARDIGALAIALRLQPLLQETLHGTMLETFRIRLANAAEPAGGYFYDSGGRFAAGESALHRQMAYGGQRWNIELQPRMATGTSDNLPLILTAGGLISLLFSMLLWSLASTRRRAVVLGTEMSERFQQSEERFRVLNDLLPALVLVADTRSGVIHYANQAARQRLGDVVAAERPLPALFSDPQLRAQADAFCAGGDYWGNIEALLSSLSGTTFWANAAIARVNVVDRESLLMVASDISEQRKLNDLLSYQATHDALTDLYNRREFERFVSQALVRPGGRRPWALLYIDLDQFKLINDISGHMAGDQLLAQLAFAMRQQLREGDVLARLGGDEFGLVAYDLDQEEALQVADRMRRCIEGLMFVWDGRTYTVSASIGVVMVERGGISLKHLLAWADTACYQAKESGRNRVHVYREDDATSRRQSEMQWANKIRWAMEENRLLLEYQQIQPLQDGAGGEPHFELLLRLRDEDGRIISPGFFLPAAERYGLMPTIDRWVIQQALANFSRLHASGTLPGLCAINLSGASIEDDDLADFILDLIRRHQVPPARLCFEITETVAVRSLLKVVQFIERLRAAGCSIALDDFGAGMSSFGYLKNLPADIIKIDGSFIQDLDHAPMSRTIVTAITQIGHQLGKKVVAEWVSNASILQTLRDLGVDMGQGFELHKPQPVLFQQQAVDGTGS